jgi:hypothetical protein
VVDFGASAGKGVVIVPEGHLPGSTFRAAAPKPPRTNPLFGGAATADSPAFRGVVVGCALGTGLVASPFALYGGTQTAKIIAPICTVPVATLMVAVGAYSARLEAEQVEEEQVHRTMG